MDISEILKALTGPAAVGLFSVLGGHLFSGGPEGVIVVLLVWVAAALFFAFWRAKKEERREREFQAALDRKDIECRAAYDKVDAVRKESVDLLKDVLEKYHTSQMSTHELVRTLDRTVQTLERKAS